MFSIALDERILRGIEIFLATQEDQCGNQFKQVPAEACVVEVDQTDGVAVHQQILGGEVGMNQAVAVGRLAVGREIFANPVTGPLEKPPLGA